MPETQVRGQQQPDLNLRFYGKIPHGAPLRYLRWGGSRPCVWLSGDQIRITFPPARATSSEGPAWKNLWLDHVTDRLRDYAL